MTQSSDQDKRATTLSLRSATLQLKTKTAPAVNAAPRGGNQLKVEVKRRRLTAGEAQEAAQNSGTQAATTDTPAISTREFDDGLTASERHTRLNALKQAATGPRVRKENRLLEHVTAEEEAAEQQRLAKEALEKASPRTPEKSDTTEKTKATTAEPPRTSATKTTERSPAVAADIVREARDKRKRSEEEEAISSRLKGEEDSRRFNKRALLSQTGDQDERVRSLASVRRAREKAKRREQAHEVREKIIREVVLPEVISVQELSNRMAERLADVTKSLMKMGMIVTPQQNIDADTAELVISEFGHKVRRVTESDVENILKTENDAQEEVQKTSRPPVVTIMGHVDHGKTSLLDALRSARVAEGEAGGITQHIGAYQVTSPSGQLITFIDTPGHEAFTSMRKRGANATDIVILVVAADDGIMAQTVEAIHHAKAAGVPIIVAINKMDKPGAEPQRVRQQLLEHELVVEEFGGEVLSVEVSAKQRINLDKLLETILLQSEVLDLKANSDRRAQGVVIEAKVDKGRGHVATVLVQNGTLRIGDILLAGGVSGKVRAIVNAEGSMVKEAGPSTPVQVLGLAEAPSAGDPFDVVESERQAKEIAEYRQKKIRDRRSVAEKRGTLEELFSQAGQGKVKEVSVIIKGDVHGSIEAIAGSLAKLTADSTEVHVRVLHTAVGGINESDVSLASASNAIIIGFNVRADASAKALAEKEGTDIRYYTIIYDLVDDVKALLSGMLAPHKREQYLGTAEIRQVFHVSRVGTIAGCFVTDGTIKRGARVRLLRDNIVIHEGKLKTLRRFKDDVKEVASNFECGMAFENYDDLKEKDMIEAFEVVEEKRSL